MRLYRAQVLHTPDDPFRGVTLRADADAGLLVVDGMIAERGPYAELRRRRHDEPVVDPPASELPEDPATGHGRDH